MRSFWLAIAVLAAMTRLAHADTHAKQDNSAARAQIQQVVETFRTAIITKDKSTMGSLFMPSGGSWIKVLGDEVYPREKAKQPSTEKLQPGNYQQFLDFLGTNQHRLEEKFLNVHIDTDGVIASVYFDYTFVIDDKEHHRGSEAWQLVKTGDGWTINAMCYSVDSVTE
jgi:hypothetical protein